MSNTTYDPVLFRRVLVSLFSAQALYSAATVGTFALMPIIVEKIGGNAAIIGLPATMLLIGRAVSAYPVGWIMDTAGRRVGLTLGYLVGALGFFTALVSVQQGWLWPFIGSSFLLGGARSAADQSRFTAAEVAPPDGRAKAMGMLIFANTIGAITGPLLMTPSGNAAEAFGYRFESGSWMTGSLLGLLAAVVVYAFLNPDPSAVIQKQRAGQPPEKADLGALFSIPRVRLAVFALMISQAVMTLIMVITPLSVVHQHHSIEAVPWIIMAHTVGMWGFSNVTGWLTDRFGRIVMLALGGLMLLASAIITPLSPDIVPIAFALFLLGLGWNFAFLASSSLFADSLGSVGRGRAQGVSESVSALASGAGSIGTGVLYATGNLVAVGVVGSVLSILLLVAVGWLSWNERGGLRSPAGSAQVSA